MNNKQSIDISVPSYREIEGPLGGKSTEYIVKVIAKQNALDKNSNNNEVINHQTAKSFRECEDFLLKLPKKYPGISFPCLPKSLSNPTTSAEKRAQALNDAMKFISLLPEIGSSPLLLQFLGINLEDFEKPTKEIDEDDMTDNSTIFKKMKIKNKKSESPDNENSNDNPKTVKKTEIVNPTSSLSEDEQDEDIFKQSRKRNETGSRPLFDENSINQRSERLNQREPIMFNPQDYGGASSPDESIFNISGEKSFNCLSITDENLEDTSELLSIQDDIDHLLKEAVSNRKQGQKNPASKSVETHLSDKPPVPRKPTPATRSANLKSNPSSVQKPQPPPKPHSLSKKTVQESEQMRDIDIRKYIEDEENKNYNEPDLFS